MNTFIRNFSFEIHFSKFISILLIEQISHFIRSWTIEIFSRLSNIETFTRLSKFETFLSIKENRELFIHVSSRLRKIEHCQLASICIYVVNWSWTYCVFSPATFLLVKISIVCVYKCCTSMWYEYDNFMLPKISGKQQAPTFKCVISICVLSILMPCYFLLK